MKPRSHSDSETLEIRSKIMRSVRRSGTAPEAVVCVKLRELGIRFETNCTDLPGSPDIVLRSSRLAVFVHGCFWHRHDGCRLASIPRSNVEFWLEKFGANRRRDRRNRDCLRALGWKTMVLWQCEIEKNVEGQIARILKRSVPERK